MRIFTTHDVKGHIHEVVISPTGAPPATVSTDTGLLVTEVEASEVMSGLDLSDPERSRRHLDKVVQQLQELRVQIRSSLRERNCNRSNWCDLVLTGFRLLCEQSYDPLISTTATPIVTRTCFVGKP